MCRDNSDFWPVAVVVGLLPGKALAVPIVVTAEDGITSLSYTVRQLHHPCCCISPVTPFQRHAMLSSCRPLGSCSHVSSEPMPFWQDFLVSHLP